MHSVQTSEIAAVVKQAAKDAGFDLAGIAPATGGPELEYFAEWIADGRAGEMEYLKSRDEQGALKRASLSRVAPWARSVVVCAINYNTDHPYSTQTNDPNQGWISRYAWSREDYHDVVLRRLKQVEAALRKIPTSRAENAREMGHPAVPTELQAKLTTRCYVDTGPIVERVFAKYAGVGWIGKNTCVINQKKGSWLFLGVILTSLELAPDVSASNPPAPDRCGTCTRCIQACPTEAIIAPYQLDSNRCIPTSLSRNVEQSRKSSAPGWAATFSVAMSARTSAPGIAKPRYPRHANSSRVPAWSTLPWHGSLKCRPKNFARRFADRPCAAPSAPASAETLPSPWVTPVILNFFPC